MKTHNLKIQEDFADAIVSGDKTFEIRKNDRGYQKGDYIKFDKVIERGSSFDCFDILTHPIRDKLYVITYVMSGWGLKDDFVVFGIKEVSTTTTNNEEITVMEYPQVPGITPTVVV